MSAVLTLSDIPSPRPQRHWWRWLIALAVVGPVMFLGPWALLSLSTNGERYTVVTVPSRPVALVFGAGLEVGGGPSAFLADRLDLAVALWQRGKVAHVLVSGDNSTRYHDEVTAMQKYLLSHGVPESVITRDYAGFDTYSSCYRAHAIFGVTSAVLVTTDYHLARALWTCSRVGVRAVGVGVSEWGRFPGSMPRFQARELLSDAKALWETEFSHPKPKFLGPREVLH